MAEHPTGPAGNSGIHHEIGPAGYDSELSASGLRRFAIGLALLVILSALGMWGFSHLLRSRLAAADPPLPLLPEAREAWVPPGPALQTHFTTDIERLRAIEDTLLHDYAWVDQPAGRVRIPIERAMELIAAGSGDSPASADIATTTEDPPAEAPVAQP